MFLETLRDHPEINLCREEETFNDLVRLNILIERDGWDYVEEKDFSDNLYFLRYILWLENFADWYIAQAWVFADPSFFAWFDDFLMVRKLYWPRIQQPLIGCFNGRLRQYPPHSFIFDPISGYFTFDKRLFHKRMLCDQLCPFCGRIIERYSLLDQIYDLLCDNLSEDNRLILYLAQEDFFLSDQSNSSLPLRSLPYWLALRKAHRVKGAGRS